MGKHYREPIKHTCPDIDKLIKGITEIQKLTKNYQKIDEIDANRKNSKERLDKIFTDNIPGLRAIN